MCDLVSFSFSEHYLRGEMLDNRIKPKIFVPFIERGFIFVQYSHFLDNKVIRMDYLDSLIGLKFMKIAQRKDVMPALVSFSCVL